MNTVETVVENYDKVLSEVKTLSPNATLVLASKMVSKEVLQGLASCRKVIYGENRVQELLSKYFESESLTWHFIGRLQTNKVKYIVDKVSLIQSVDSVRLAEEIEMRSAGIGKTMDILVEVNVGEEASKGGVSESELDGLLEAVSHMPHLRLLGLMSVLPDVKEEALVPLYAHLYDLFRKVAQIKKDNFDVRVLSAGMSGDYVVALKNGSNMVRLGSKVFGARNY